MHKTDPMKTFVLSTSASDLICQGMLVESEPHIFVAEASELQLPPGTWPAYIHVDGLGNGQPFVRTSKKVDREGDILRVRYRQALGCVDILIFND